MIELTDVHVTFNKGKPLESRALRGVNLLVREREFVTVIGSNGAGKSTALNVIAGTVPIDRGALTLDGRDFSREPVHRRAEFISRVFQDPKMGTCEDLTVIENFALAYGRTAPRRLRFAVDRRMRVQTAERLKPLGLGLERRLDDRVGLLSGGQRQAISLLMATTGETKLLLLDEHTAALDPKTAGFVLELTRRVVSEIGLTAIMVTHSMAQALEVGDRTVMFHQGKIVFDVSGPERQSLKVPDLLDLFRQNQNEELSDDALLLG